MISAETLRWSLEELASKEEQERLWLGRNKDEISSFEEARCGVFDDAGLTRAIDSGFLADNYSEAFCGKVDELHRSVKSIPDNSKPEDVLNHPEMERIRCLATALLEMLPNEGLS
jgi:Lon protease-like protein